MSEVKLEINTKNGYFHIDIDGKQEAKMTFVFAGADKIIINHTEVTSGNEGKGFGKKMLTKAVGYAREKASKSFRFVHLSKASLLRFPSLGTFCKDKHYLLPK